MVNEKRLIDASAFLNTLQNWYPIAIKNGDIGTIRTIEDVMEELSEQPTVDAVEVVHGRWIRSEPGYRLCSHCMADVAIYSGHTNYCPNCGAKMDMEVDK